MTPEPQSLVAVLPPGDQRTAWWVELFTAPRVPVVDETPYTTILPDGRERLCYFVDFDSCEWLMPRLIECCRKRGNNPATMNMLRQRLYPLIAENVTIVRAPRRIWQNTE